ncbi:hypothetical protein Rcae01_06479 [Novipirellula caenicola]|uniref:Uncharacterized protein n=1 Tax=Novipirellula caenicola TaxID=1536901 RepID=A0ABP9W478_9BACT
MAGATLVTVIGMVMVDSSESLPSPWYPSSLIVKVNVANPFQFSVGVKVNPLSFELIFAIVLVPVTVPLPPLIYTVVEPSPVTVLSTFATLISPAPAVTSILSRKRGLSAPGLLVSTSPIVNRFAFVSLKTSGVSSAVVWASADSLLATGILLNAINGASLLAVSSTVTVSAEDSFPAASIATTVKASRFSPYKLAVGVQVSELPGLRVSSSTASPLP